MITADIIPRSNYLMTDQYGATHHAVLNISKDFKMLILYGFFSRRYSSGREKNNYEQSYIFPILRIREPQKVSSKQNANYDRF